MKLLIKKTHPSAKIPTRAKPGDSGLDLHALLPDGDATVWPGEGKLFRTGIAIELPAPGVVLNPWGRAAYGYEAQVRPRSGLAARNGLQACLGTVDNGYRGEIGVVLFNLSPAAAVIRDGDRIAQLVICPVTYPEVTEVDELSKTERGASGFGSTGV